MMRQAGRYQPSYRAVRQQVGFLELCRSPELIAKVTCAPIDEFGFDAAILFSDILVHLPAMGLDLTFEKGEKGKGDGGPKIANPVRTRADVEALKVPVPTRDLKYVLDGIRAINAGLAGRVPLIGFVGGPFTVASYVVEGGSQGFTRLKTMLYAEPDDGPRPLREAHPGGHRPDRGADRRRGPRRPDLRELAGRAGPRGPRARSPSPTWPASPRRSRRPGCPSIFFATGMSGHLERLAGLGFDVISVDWRIPIDEARRRAPGVAIQGNLDSTVMLGPSRGRRGEGARHLPGGRAGPRLHLQPGARHPGGDAARERQGGGRRGPRLPVEVRLPCCRFPPGT